MASTPASPRTDRRLPAFRVVNDLNRKIRLANSTVWAVHQNEQSESGGRPPQNISTSALEKQKRHHGGVASQVDFLYRKSQN